MDMGHAADIADTAAAAEHRTQQSAISTNK